MSAKVATKAFDVVIVGGGHNGLISASYLAKAGLTVAVLERRHTIGGAAVTEEMVPGFKFSRASYLLSLLRPKIVKELDLKSFGLKVHLRNPSSFTPKKDGSGYLLLGRDSKFNFEQISKFSKADAVAYGKYEQMLDKFSQAIDPLLDSVPVNLKGSFFERLKGRSAFYELAKIGLNIGKDLPDFIEIMSAPASKILDRWFESDILKATLATDAVIGAFASPMTPGSGYVLFHHVMGEIEGIRGAWGYAEGGMGAVSNAIAKCAQKHGAEIFTNAEVGSIDIENGVAKGVTLKDGTQFTAKHVMSNTTSKVTFLDLIDQKHLPEKFLRSVKAIDYSSATMKINVAIDRLPNFKALPNKGIAPQPNHFCTTHFEEDMGDIHKAYLDALSGKPSDKPVIELCVPSSLDPTIAPPGKHVVTLFVQYAPYNLKKGESWDDLGRKEAYADKVFSIIDEYAPGFSSSVVGRDILSPLDLERTFGLTGGNIFHGSMSLDQLYFMRPLKDFSNYTTPIPNLYICGSSAHPGGGVMGAAGRNSAFTLLGHLGKKIKQE